MAPRRAKVINKLDYRNLTEIDVICPLCRSILIKPVTLPCSHGFCASCFENTTQNANLVCPVCKVRIGSWLRSTTRSKKQVNEGFWQAIQASFPLQVKQKLGGNEENMEVQVAGNAQTGVDLAQKDALASTSKVTASQKLSNFATKEYTCRILCQNISNDQKYNSHFQRKHKRIQNLLETEVLSSRSNSIDSECIYFKPIDYRRNPPSEGLTPIKVPSIKPNLTANFKILAPCGQNKINMNYLESAFARLMSKMPGSPEVSTKRKLERADNKSKKKMKTINPKSSESKESVSDLHSMSNIKNTARQITKKFMDEEKSRRCMQEKADFELAKKLQQSYNQSPKYSTRSAVVKKLAIQKQLCTATV